MSELERIRATTLLSVITVVLVALLALRGGDSSGVVPAHDTLELCAVSKGALCDVVPLAPHSAQLDRVSASGDAGPSAAASRASEQDFTVATIGTMTVVAAALPANRFAELSASRDAVAHLALLTEPAQIQAAHVTGF